VLVAQKSARQKKARSKDLDSDETAPAADSKNAKNEAEKLSPAERDQRLETIGRERWKKADPKGKPEVTSGARFLLFGNLPKARATATLRTLDTQYTTMQRLLRQVGSTSQVSREKISVYVFNDRTPFVEFVRTVGGKEIDAGEQVYTELSASEPYVAAVDPFGGKDEPPPARKAPRPKRGGGEGAAARPNRSLASLLVESVVAASVAQRGQAPQWVTLGLGAFFAARAEPRGSYGPRLRREALQLSTQGWNSKATDALGGVARPDEIRAVGFAIFECLASEDPALIREMIRGMLEGQEKLDTTIQQVLDGMTRDGFLTLTNAWVVDKYGQGQ
jgi:hypothetical protein